MYTWKKWQEEKGYPEGKLITYRINNCLSGQSYLKQYAKEVRGKNDILVTIPNDPHNLLALDQMERIFHKHPIEA